MADPISGYTIAQNNIDLSTSAQDTEISYGSVTGLRPLSEYANGNTSINNPSASNILRYPNAQLEDTADWFEIKVVKYQAPGYERDPGTLRFGTGTEKIRNKESGSIRNPVAYIHLPIPKQLSDGNSVDWGADRLNPFAGMAADAVEGLIANPGNVGSILKDAYSTGVNVVQTGEGQKATISAIAAKIVNSLGANTSTGSILGRSSGTIINPNLELLFNSVNLRQFEFTFDFSPRDSYEGQIVKKIIRTFKQSMSAKTNVFGGPGSGLLISAPDVFELKFKSGNKDHPFLNAFKTCALADIRLNYAASGAYSTYSDGTPVHIEMALTFKELNPVYNEDYNSEDAGTGVGY
jgi:hypothetical protein